MATALHSADAGVNRYGVWRRTRQVPRGLASVVDPRVGLGPALAGRRVTPLLRNWLRDSPIELAPGCLPRAIPLAHSVSVQLSKSALRNGGWAADHTRDV